MKKQLFRIGRILVLASGLALSGSSLLVMVLSGDLAVRMVSALVFAAGLIVLLLSMLVVRMDVFRTILRHVQYLTQSSEYTARLLREITEVMKAIEEAEAEERSRKDNNSGTRAGAYVDDLTPEERELESTVRQFEM